MNCTKCGQVVTSCRDLYHGDKWIQRYTLSPREDSGTFTGGDLSRSSFSTIFNDSLLRVLFGIFRIGWGDLMEWTACWNCGTRHELFTSCPTCYEIKEGERIERETRLHEEKLAREAQREAEDLARREAEERERLLDRQIEEERRISEETLERQRSIEEEQFERQRQNDIEMLDEERRIAEESVAEQRDLMEEEEENRAAHREQLREDYANRWRYQADRKHERAEGLLASVPAIAVTLLEESSPEDPTDYRVYESLCNAHKLSKS